MLFFLMLLAESKEEERVGPIVWLVPRPCWRPPRSCVVMTTRCGNGAWETKQSFHCRVVIAPHVGNLTTHASRKAGGDKALLCSRFKLQLNTIVAALADLMLIYDHNAGLVAELYGRVKESNCWGKLRGWVWMMWGLKTWLRFWLSWRMWGKGDAWVIFQSFCQWRRVRYMFWRAPLWMPLGVFHWFGKGAICYGNCKW